MPSVSRYICQGVKLVGLVDIFRRPTPASVGNWTMNDGTITFQAGAGANEIIFLPYIAQQNASVAMAGKEVISGEFTGCVMSIYRDSDGAVYASHIDTAEWENERPGKTAWIQKKKGNGFQLLSEFSTNNLISDFLAIQPNENVRNFGLKLVGICIADPANSSITYAIVYRDNGIYTVVQTRRGEQRPMV